jgi:hypothetical protein
VDATYNNRSALLMVLRVLRLDAERSAASTPVWATLCDAATPSTTWRLLDANDETAWYAGQKRTWSFDARRLASYGAGGLRLGLLASNATQKLSAFAAQFNLGGDLRDTFIIPDVGVESEKFAHTIAQRQSAANMCPITSHRISTNTLPTCSCRWLTLCSWAPALLVGDGPLRWRSRLLWHGDSPRTLRSEPSKVLPCKLRLLISGSRDVQQQSIAGCSLNSRGSNGRRPTHQSAPYIHHWISHIPTNEGRAWSSGAGGIF